MRLILAEPEEESEIPAKRPKRRRWLRVLAALGIIGILLLVWLNGPGLRWLAPKVAAHFLPQAGLTGDFKLEGSVTGGLSIRDLHLEGAAGSLKKLTVERVTPLYEFSRLVRGEVIGISAEGVHADLRLGVESPPKEEKPFNLQELVQTIRGARDKVLPLKIDLRRLSLNAERDGQPEFSLEPTDIIHPAGSDTISLNIGRMVGPTGLELAAQQSALVWRPEQLSLQQLDPYPGVGIRDLALDLPAAGDPAARARLLVDGAVFDLETGPGFAGATLALTSGSLQVEKTAEKFGAKIPVSALLTSFSLNLDGILPDPKAVTGDLRIGFEAVKYEDWTAPELTVGATIEAEKASVAVAARSLETPILLNAEAPISRGAKFLLGEATGTLNVANVPALLGELAKRFPAIKVEQGVPDSSLAGNFKVAFDDANQPKGAEAELLLKPVDEKEVSAVLVRGTWAPDAPVSGEVEMDGLKVAGRYEIPAKRYSGTLALENFQNARVDRWLAVGGVKLDGQLGVTANWSGSGDLVSGVHRGDLVLGQAGWVQAEKPPITALGSVSYEWPGKVNVENLKVETQQQTVVLNGGLADGMLELKRFAWSDGPNEMASGSASLPVPADFSKWRETLAQDKRAVNVAIDSQVISLAKLEPWLPAAAQLDAKSTGHVMIRIGGSYPAPQVDVAMDFLNLRSPTQPKLPPADLRITLKGNEGKLALDGTATAPDFPPAVIKAAMAFKPADWAAEPGIVLEEPVEARVDLPRLDLSRFASLVPAAKKLTGIATGNVVVGGKVGKPEMRGSLNLSNGGLVLANGDFPPITGVAADVDLNLEKVEVKTLKATIAGGSVQAGGSLLLADGKPGPIDFRVKGDHLPLVRNEMMIVRASADLHLEGPFETAVLSGSVGIVDSLFYRDIELLPIGTTSRGGAAAGQLPKIDAAKTNPTASVPAPFSNWGLNVTLKTDDPFLIRGNLGTGEANMLIKVGGTIGNPAPDGSVRIRDGVAVLPFSTLKVADGTIVFTPETGFDPVLEIRGQADPRPYRVDVYVHGRLSNPQLVLTSNPPLPENEIMTLLATGTTTAGLENTQAASSRALQLLLEELRRGRLPFARQLRPVLKVLDRVDFNLAEADPYDGDSFSTATIALTDRWYVSAGMGSEGDTRFLGIWRISFR
jgi:hypothetical protein